MRPFAISTSGRRELLSRIAWVPLVCLAGCCGPLLPSGRHVPSAHTSGPVPVGAHACATADPAVIPSAGYCGADDCPPLFSAHACSRLLAGPRCWIRRCGGPLLDLRHRHGEGGGTVEAELNPPHSRFHPVPASPVFAQRDEYAPPERMMQPAPPVPHRTAPGAPQPTSPVPPAPPFDTHSPLIVPESVPMRIEPPGTSPLPDPLPAHPT